MRRVFALLVLLAVVQTATAGRGFSATKEAACGFAESDKRDSPIFADTKIGTVPLNALEERLFADAADGRLDEFTPLNAALVAGGVDNVDTLRHYEQKAKALVEELRRSGTLIGSQRHQAEAVFEFMHRRVLHGGYDLAYTDLRRVMDEGRFNCVSATVLFNYLAGEIGLDCRGLEMPGHAMSRVRLPDGVFDVETTCPCSFHLGDPKEQVAVASKAIGSAASADVSKAHVCGKRDSPIFVDHRCALVPAKIGTVPREVTPIQLAAMIYYNRGVDLLAEKRFAEAAAANAKALRLDPNNATARGNLLATINNWSIELGNTQHFAEAVELLRQGLAMDAKFEAFTQNYIHVHRQWAEQLSREGRFEEAKRVKAQAGAMVPLPCVQRRPVVD